MAAVKKGKTIKPDRESEVKVGGKGYPTPGMKGGYGATGGRKQGLAEMKKKKPKSK